MKNKKRFFSKPIQTLISTIFIIIAYILYKTFGYDTITIIIMICSTAFSGIHIFKKAIAGLRYKIIGIELLVTIAVVGAIIIKEYWEAAAVTFLFLLGEYLESKTIEKTRSALKELMDIAPKQARVVRKGEETFIDPEEVMVGEIIIVKTGEKISVDGMVSSGSAYVNQASITGEPLPIHRKVNDDVFSGTTIESGYLQISATKVGEDTAFSNIIHLVEEAQDQKAKTQKFIERFSRYYTPAIILLAIIVFAFTQNIKLALTLLVISCPGALVISTPVSIVAGIGNAAKKGILFKGGESIEGLGKAEVIAFDKTGTLTYGMPKVVDVVVFSWTKEEILKYTAWAEIYSEHPLGKAIVSAYEKYNKQFTSKIPEVNHLLGQGISFHWEELTYFIGNRSLFAKEEINKIEAIIQKHEQSAESVVIFGTYSQIIGFICIADEIRPEAKAVISYLKTNKFSKVVMLTGDSNKTAQAVANELGITDVYSQLLPESKVEKIKQLQSQHKNVVFVGDGINDAPALATANNSIAVGGAGKDVAMETAGIVLLSNSLNPLIDAIALSKATVKNLWQNIIFALLVVVILLVGVLFEQVHLALGMLVHELSVLLVILNAVRLLTYKKRS